MNKKVARYGISVIICTHNGAERIISTLGALSHQHIPAELEWEILIVDNGSDDGTVDLALSFTKNQNLTTPLRIISQPLLGKANALVTGYNEAIYELMVLCDDDNWLQPEYLKTVFEIYNDHPDIGLLGGFGKAVFNPEERPSWFDTWEHSFVCGEHHAENGYLKPYDFSIWGAGSVIRKKMWNFLHSNGFNFINSTKAGKAMTEDAELSLAITFTGEKLYYDNRLWFYHDLRGGRITWKKFLKQQSINGKNMAVLSSYWIAHFRIQNPGISFNRAHIRHVLGVFLSFLIECFKINKFPKIVCLGNTLGELLARWTKYRKIAKESMFWINNIQESYPLGKET